MQKNFNGLKIVTSPFAGWPVTTCGSRSMPRSSGRVAASHLKKGQTPPPFCPWVWGVAHKPPHNGAVPRPPPTPAWRLNWGWIQFFFFYFLARFSHKFFWESFINFLFFYFLCFLYFFNYELFNCFSYFFNIIYDFSLFLYFFKVN